MTFLIDVTKKQKQKSFLRKVEGEWIELTVGGKE